MIIPLDQLQPDTLTAIIEHFVLGEGTDYGETEYGLEQKVAHVRAQLEDGTALLVYSQCHESVTIMTRRDYAQAARDQRGEAAQ